MPHPPTSGRSGIDDPSAATEDTVGVISGAAVGSGFFGLGFLVGSGVGGCSGVHKSGLVTNPNTSIPASISHSIPFVIFIA